MTMSLRIESISISNLTSLLYYLFYYLILFGYPNKLWILYSLTCRLGVSFLPSYRDIIPTTTPSFTRSRDNFPALRSLTISYDFHYRPVKPTQLWYRTWLIRVQASSFPHLGSSDFAPYPIFCRICPGLSCQPDCSDWFADPDLPKPPIYLIIRTVIWMIT
jgi:hypothetical protein